MGQPAPVRPGRGGGLLRVSAPRGFMVEIPGDQGRTLGSTVWCMQPSACAATVLGKQRPGWKQGLCQDSCSTLTDGQAESSPEAQARPRAQLSTQCPDPCAVEGSTWVASSQGAPIIPESTPVPGPSVGPKTQGRGRPASPCPHSMRGGDRPGSVITLRSHRLGCPCDSQGLRTAAPWPGDLGGLPGGGLAETEG